MPDSRNREDLVRARSFRLPFGVVLAGGLALVGAYGFFSPSEARRNPSQPMDRSWLQRPRTCPACMIGHELSPLSGVFSSGHVLCPAIVPTA